MKPTNQTQSESTQHDDFSVRETADNINDGIKFVDNANSVRNVAQGLAAGGAMAGAAAATGGAGMMSGLAAVGGVVGGGAVAGIGVLGAAPAAAAKMVMNQVLADDDRLSDEEREARGVLLLAAWEQRGQSRLLVVLLD
jgi:hypothetical protein